MYEIDENIKICPVCKGWGKLPGREMKTCDQCNNDSVYLQDHNEMIKIDFPTFVNYSQRRRIKFLKIFIITIIILLLFLAIGVAIFLILDTYSGV